MMPSSSSPSETPRAAYDELYGVRLLDDLHNYFPALLYEPASFDDVSDVLNYVAARSSQQFDLYSYGREAYLESNRRRRLTLMGRGGLQQAVASNQIYSRPTGEPTVTAASSTSEPLSQSTPQETSTNAQVAGRRLLYTQQQPLTQSLLTALLAPNLQTIYPPVERRLMTLTNLANLIHYLDNTSTGLENAIPPGFLDPVRIPPTEDQIDAATVVEVPQDQETATCSVCQDSFEAEQEARKILHCGHLFHLECIDTWFEQASTCPTCRYDIREYQANNPPPAEIPPQSDLDGVE